MRLLQTKDVIPTGDTKRRQQDGANVRKDVRYDLALPADITVQQKLIAFTHYKRVADYLLGKTIGEGSFARVRLGLHAQTAEEVAVKVISKAKALKDAYVHKNLRREGRILQMTRHPNIIQVYDILETDNNYYLVTEFCGGGELIDIVTDRGCLPECDVRKYIVQLVSAVAHLHERGIVHRDLKVENLLLDDRGDLKVIDFGLSNVYSSDSGDQYSVLKTQCGSPAYAAPELLAKKAYGPKVDVWSIGIITYALLVGKLPFTTEPFRIPKLCRKMMAGDMNPIPTHLTSSCKNFIKRLLIAEPQGRPNIKQVLRMKWIENTTKSSIFNKTSFCNGTVDAHLIHEMVSRHGFDSAKVTHCVKRNRPGEALAMYHLLVKRAIRLKQSPEKSTVGSTGSDYNLNKDRDDDTPDEPYNETNASPSKHTTENSRYEKSSDVHDSKDSAYTAITPVKNPELNGDVEHAPNENKENRVQHNEKYSVTDLFQTPSKKQETTVRDSTSSARVVREKTLDLPKEDNERITAYHDQVNHEPKLPKLNSEANQNVHPEKNQLPIILRDNANVRPKSVTRKISRSRDIATPNYKDSISGKNDVEIPKIQATLIDARVYDVSPTNSRTDRASSVKLQQYEAKRHESVTSNSSSIKLQVERPRTSGNFWDKRSVNLVDSYPSRMNVSKKLTPRILSMFHKNRKQSVPKMTKYTPRSSYCDRDSFDTKVLPSITQVPTEFKYKSARQWEKSRSLRSTGTVKDIIEKFDGMTEHTNDRHQPIQLRQENYELSIDHRPNAPPLTAYKPSREKQATRMYFQNTPNSRQSTRSKIEDQYFAGKNDSSFVSHFSDRSRNTGSFFRNNGSASAASQRTQSRGVWYKSLV